MSCVSEALPDAEVLPWKAMGRPFSPRVILTEAGVPVLRWIGGIGCRRALPAGCNGDFAGGTETPSGRLIWVCQGS